LYATCCFWQSLGLVSSSYYLRSLHLQRRVMNILHAEELAASPD
jgi:hypothetical protein